MHLGNLDFNQTIIVFSVQKCSSRFVDMIDLRNLRFIVGAGVRLLTVCSNTGTGTEDLTLPTLTLKTLDK